VFLVFQDDRNSRDQVDSQWRRLGESNGAFRLFAMLVAVVFGLMEIRRYYQGWATTFDLGSTAQSLYLISHGHWLAYNTFLGNFTILDIDAFVLYLLALPFRFFGGPVFLFLVQTMALMVFGWASYDYTFHRIKNASIAWVIGLLALVSPAVFGGLFFDFHVDFIALGGLSLALYGMMRQSRYITVGSILLALLSKNVAAIPVVIWGLIETWNPEVFSRRFWALVTGVAMGVFGVDEVVIPRLFHAGPSHLKIYSQYGHYASEIVMTLLRHPSLIIDAVILHAQYLISLSGAWGFLPLTAGLYMFPFLSLIVLNDLGNNPALQSLQSQYSVIIGFFGMISAVWTLESIKKPTAWVVAAIVGILATIYLDHGIMYSEVLPALSQNVLASLEFRSAARLNRHPSLVIWTTNHLGALVYGHRVVGVDTYEKIDALFRQRQQLDPRAPVVLFMPLNNANWDINWTMWKALREGYRIRDRNSAVVVLQGEARIPSYPSDAFTASMNEANFTRSFPELFPAVMSYGNGRFLPDGWLVSRGPGLISRSVPTALPSGLYRFSFYFSDSSRGQPVIGRILLDSIATHRPLSVSVIRRGQTSVSWTWTNPHDQWVEARIVITTQSSVRYFGFKVESVASHHDISGRGSRI